MGWRLDRIQSCIVHRVRHGYMIRSKSHSMEGEWGVGKEREGGCYQRRVQSRKRIIRPAYLINVDNRLGSISLIF